MTIVRLFALLAIMVGLSGSIFLVKSILILNPKKMLDLTTPRSYINYAPAQVKSFAQQKSDALSGVFLILIAFIIQLFSLVILDGNEIKIFKKVLGSIIALGITFGLVLIFYLINRRLYKKNKLGIDKEAVKQECIEKLSRHYDVRDLEHLESFAKSLLNFEKKNIETRAQFFRRLFEYIEWSPPNNIDLNQLDNI